MMGDKQSQKSGDASTNIQAGGDVSVGLSYSETRQVAMDVYRANFIELRDTAAAVARARAEELIDRYLEEMRREGFEAIPGADSPDLQHAIYSAQKEHARAGDEDLGELLVQLLVDRTKTPERNLTRIVLNESLSVAPKLTQDQLDALSLVFISKYTVNNGLLSLDLLHWHLDKYVLPFVAGASRKDSAYQHLEFAGCGNVSIGELQAEQAFANSYSGLLSKGFTEAEAQTVDLSPSARAALITTCLHDSSLLQVNAMNSDALETLCAPLGVEPEKIEGLKQLQTSKLMSPAEIKTFLIGARQQMSDFFELWGNTSMKNMTLTSVGIAVAHANIQRRIDVTFDLSIWL